MLTVYFHASLQKFTKVKQHSFDVEDFTSLVSGVKEIFPELERYQNTLQHTKENGEICVYLYDKKHIVPEIWLLKNSIPEDRTELWLVPSVYGGGKIGKVIAGVALVALGAFLGEGAAAGTLLSFAAQAVVGIGVNLILGALLTNQFKPAKQDTPTDAPTRRDNDFFDGLVNTVDSGKLIPLNYGQMRTAGHLASGFVKTSTHGLPEPEVVPVDPVVPEEPTSPREEIVDDFGGD